MSGDYLWKLARERALVADLTTQLRDTKRQLRIAKRYIPTERLNEFHISVRFKR